MNRDSPSTEDGRSERLLSDRQTDARLAHVRQELLAPVNAIAGYADILRDEAARLGLPALMPDIDRILASAEALLEPCGRPPGCQRPQSARHEVESLTDFQERLLHDLRNPLNAIKGYGEMLLEDIVDLGGVSLRQDLERLLTEAARLLASLEWIVNFTSYHAASAETEAERTRLMAADPLLAIRAPDLSQEQSARNGEDPGCRRQCQQSWPSAASPGA